MGKVAEARFQALNDGWLPVQDKGAAAFSYVVFKAPFLLGFWAAFCMRALFHFLILPKSVSVIQLFELKKKKKRRSTLF